MNHQTKLKKLALFIVKEKYKSVLKLTFAILRLYAFSYNKEKPLWILMIVICFEKAPLQQQFERIFQNIRGGAKKKFIFTQKANLYFIFTFYTHFLYSLFRFPRSAWISCFLCIVFLKSEPFQIFHCFFAMDFPFKPQRICHN